MTLLVTLRLAAYWILWNNYVPTKLAALCLINMLLNNKKGGMGEFIPNLLPIFLWTLFQMVLNAILGLFACDHILLEKLGSTIVKNSVSSLTPIVHT